MKRTGSTGCSNPRRVSPYLSASCAAIVAQASVVTSCGTPGRGGTKRRRPSCRPASGREAVPGRGYAGVALGIMAVNGSVADQLAPPHVPGRRAAGVTTPANEADPRARAKLRSPAVPQRASTPATRCTNGAQRPQFRGDHTSFPGRMRTSHDARRRTFQGPGITTASRFGRGRPPAWAHLGGRRATGWFGRCRSAEAVPPSGDASRRPGSVDPNSMSRVIIHFRDLRPTSRPIGIVVSYLAFSTDARS